jgi:exonuclease III
VGFIHRKKAKFSLIEWNHVSESIIVARFMAKVQKVTIIQCYAPNNVAEEKSKEEFYNQLQSSLDESAPRNILIFFGDMKIKVERDNTGRELIIRKEGIGDTNEN